MEEKALYEKFEELLKEFHTTPYGVAKKACVSQPTLSDWKLGKSEPKRKTLEKICAAYGKGLSYFYGTTEENSEPKFSQKDEKDIAKRLEETLAILEDSQTALMFSGEPLDAQTRELLKASLENSMRIAKINAKQKFTPKKYRNEE